MICWNTTVSVLFSTRTGTLRESPATTHTLKTTTTVSPTTDLPSFISDVLLGREYCHEFDKCNITSPYFRSFPNYKNCYCDEICNIFNDCCSDHNPGNSWAITANQFTCVTDEKITATPRSSVGVFMVTACHADWNNSLIQYLCESDDYVDDHLLSIPVTDKDHRIFYFKNMYCAQCNYEYNFAYWTLDIECRDETRAFCFKTLLPWGSTYLRKCRTDVISDLFFE